MTWLTGSAVQMNIPQRFWRSRLGKDGQMKRSMRKKCSSLLLIGALFEILINCAVRWGIALLVVVGESVRTEWHPTNIRQRLRCLELESLGWASAAG
jgi:hypothetical protein